MWVVSLLSCYITHGQSYEVTTCLACNLAPCDDDNRDCCVLFMFHVLQVYHIVFLYVYMGTVCVCVLCAV